MLDMFTRPFSSERIGVSSPQGPQEMLAQSVLAEVPGQVTGFFNTMKLKPPQGDTPASDPSASAPPQWFIVPTVFNAGDCPL